MKETEKKVTADRRSFLKLVGAGAVTGGTALGATAASASQAAGDEKGGSYRETEHVKTYYDLARF